jgi:hypothetical protein
MLGHGRLWTRRLLVRHDLRPHPGLREVRLHRVAAVLGAERLERRASMSPIVECE